MATLEDLLDAPVEQLTDEQLVELLDKMDQAGQVQATTTAKKTKKARAHATGKPQRLTLLELSAKIQADEGLTEQEAMLKAVSLFDPRK